MSVREERKQRINALMEELFEHAESGDYALDVHTSSDIDTVCSTTTKGFRELLLVVTLARMLDQGYSPSTSLYDKRSRSPYRSPRAMYADIKPKLAERGIPHGADGPLNIAKAAEGINEAWASQRRPHVIGEKTVRLVEKLEEMDEAGLRDFATALHSRLVEEAERIEALSVEAVPEADPLNLYEVCHRLIVEAPDGGNTPHRLLGYSLLALSEESQTGIEVVGTEESASATNTTGQKPGDIYEVFPNGNIGHIYEISVKRFDRERVVDSHSSIKAYDERSGSQTSEIIVLCRKEDAHPDIEGGASTSSYLGKVEYQDVTYHFLDIYEWLMSAIVRMTPAARMLFHSKLSEYVSRPNTSETVKRLWRAIHEDSA